MDTLGIAINQKPVNPLGLSQLQAAKQLARQVPGFGDNSGAGLSLTKSFSATLANVQQGPESKNEGLQDSEAAKLREVSQQFESMLVHQMLKSMRKTVNKSELLGSFAGEQFEAMLDEEVSKEMSKSKSIGLSDTIYQQLSRITVEANR